MAVEGKKDEGPAREGRIRMNDRMAELMYGYPYNPNRYEITAEAQAVLSRMAAMKGSQVRNGAIAGADIASAARVSQIAPRRPGR